MWQLISGFNDKEIDAHFHFEVKLLGVGVEVCCGVGAVVLGGVEDGGGGSGGAE